MAADDRDALQAPLSGPEDEEETGDFSSEAESLDLAVVDLKRPRGCVPCFSAKCCCHICYVCQFLIYLIIFPLWAKWLVTSPMPVQYWHEDYDPFPPILTPGGDTIALRGGSAGRPQIQMSPIPSHPTGCNYSCRSGSTADMNFYVTMKLDDEELVRSNAHTVYPVLLASADFKDWWVVADRRHAHPQPFFASRTESHGRVYQHVTDSCSRPPEEGVEVVEAYAATYVLACVTWRTASEKALEKKPWLSYADLGKYCDAVGGVCGWACGSTLSPDRLKGCSSEGNIKVTGSSVAGTGVPGASFTGSVSLDACEEGPGQEGCTTSTWEFSKWPCHKCLFDPDAGAGSEASEERRLKATQDGDGAGDAEEGGEGGGGSATGRTIYTSLPRFMVKLHNSEPPEGAALLGAPRVFLLTSSLAEPNKWKKLYNDNLEEPPVPVEQVVQEKKADVLLPPAEHQASKYAMELHEENRLLIKPDWCFATRGPLYLVACAINSTTYADDEDFSFRSGQKVAPPPFNDRCVAVAGRCGHACQSEPNGLSYCGRDGYINQTMLVGQIHQEKNQTLPVWLFVYTLLIGFAVKVLMLCPGIFRAYGHCRRYSPDLTEQLRYMVVCAPSAGENKCTVLRNLIGGIACMPRDCRCRYHVVFTDEGHRHEQKVMWQKLTAVVAAIPNFGGATYEENVMQFFHMWVDETKKMDLNKLGESGQVVEDPIMERMAGKVALKKLRKEGGWGRFDQATLAPLEAALAALDADLRDKTQAKYNLHLDDCVDWEPKDRNSLPLRMHYLARAKPMEDERTVKAQHVAPGTWYYKVPPDARIEDWLQLRATATEMQYGIEIENDVDFNVPLRTSRGKAGGLNFTENYLTVYAERQENLYGDERDDAPFLFSICDARHQFQHDFFSTTLPYFFTENEELNVNVAFTQCPQYFHEMQDKLDYLDNNNAQFFRLNCMIRNCCGGASSCGTGGTWMIKHRDNSTVWEAEKKRVRDTDKRRRPQVVERRVFHESCKVEDTASSLQQVLLGRRSQFINRRLSYGMAKAPQDYLAAVQRWAEGGVVLSLQTFLSCHKGVYMVWIAFVFFLSFIASLIRLVSKRDSQWLVVSMGWVPKETVDQLMAPIVEVIQSVCSYYNTYLQLHPQVVQEYTIMALQLTVWVGLLAFFLVFVWMCTLCCKLLRRKCLFPDEMRWWGRLLISMDNLTYFLWFWTAFFWIGFNYYSVFATRNYHFSATGMFGFMLAVQLLTWGMIISASMRYTLEQSMETNEVIMLTMDNIWRSTQLFYITAPLLLYSIIKGTQDYMRYQFYGEDISFWTGGDRGVMSKNLVKYWTLLLIIGAFVAWIYWFIYGRQKQGTASACIIVTLIALDVLHPCTYLWVGEQKLTKEEASKMTWCQALTSKRWWQRRIYAMILNPAATGILKWLGPAWFVVMPFLTLVLPYIGVNSAFAMLGMATQR